MEIERNVLKNANYIINYFNKRGNPVTNLMVQKLLYFLEAIYMVSTDENYLYEEQFNAWDFGPVNKIIYEKYNSFENLPIKLDVVYEMPKENEKYVANLYEMFKDFSAYNLVSLSHANGSPWYELNDEYHGRIPKSTVIDKIKTKQWFSKLVTINDN